MRDVRRETQASVARPMTTPFAMHRTRRARALGCVVAAAALLALASAAPLPLQPPPKSPLSQQQPRRPVLQLSPLSSSQTPPEPHFYALHALPSSNTTALTLALSLPANISGPLRASFSILPSAYPKSQSLQILGLSLTSDDTLVTLTIAHLASDPTFNQSEASYAALALAIADSAGITYTTTLAIALLPTNAQEPGQPVLSGLPASAQLGGWELYARAEYRYAVLPLTVSVTTRTVITAAISQGAPADAVVLPHEQGGSVCMAMVKESSTRADIGVNGRLVGAEGVEARGVVVAEMPEDCGVGVDAVSGYVALRIMPFAVGDNFTLILSLSASPESAAASVPSGFSLVNDSYRSPESSSVSIALAFDSSSLPPPVFPTRPDSGLLLDPFGGERLAFRRIRNVRGAVMRQSRDLLISVRGLGGGDKQAWPGAPAVEFIANGDGSADVVFETPRYVANAGNNISAADALTPVSVSLSYLERGFASMSDVAKQQAADSAPSAVELPVAIFDGQGDDVSATVKDKHGYFGRIEASFASPKLATAGKCDQLFASVAAGNNSGLHLLSVSLELPSTKQESFSAFKAELIAYQLSPIFTSTNFNATNTVRYFDFDNTTSIATYEIVALATVTNELAHNRVETVVKSDTFLNGVRLAASDVSLASVNIISMSNVCQTAVRRDTIITGKSGVSAWGVALSLGGLIIFVSASVLGFLVYLAPNLASTEDLTSFSDLSESLRIQIGNTFCGGDFPSSSILSQLRTPASEFYGGQQRVRPDRPVDGSRSGSLQSFEQRYDSEVDTNMMPSSHQSTSSHVAFGIKYSDSDEEYDTIGTSGRATRGWMTRQSDPLLARLSYAFHNGDSPDSLSSSYIARDPIRRDRATPVPHIMEALVSGDDMISVSTAGFMTSTGDNDRTEQQTEPELQPRRGEGAPSTDVDADIDAGLYLDQSVAVDT
jgi:hypothetical protein